ncbi:resolvase [Oscillatoria sp. CS-180]|uniref:resolvase n=1 Tax=Oscillatoria sp. CS-180 TaxID=3021720 RepID=UPI002330C6AA|nr:resolvase [Oscillatoria sp. CS-180]MDB9524956.1 resolvase [Oscillatoria sp. CS-180]
MEDTTVLPETAGGMANPRADELPPDAYLTVDDVQRQIKRSRASVYRYANTDPDLLNPPFDAGRLNPEMRRDRDDPLLFHPREVRRFAQDILGLNPTIRVQPSEETTTQEILKAILVELKAIRSHLESKG